MERFMLFRASKEHFIDLKKLSTKTLAKVAASPSSALGSSRDKPDEAYCAQVLEVFKKRDIRYFFYIGGNDSANTCYIINMMAEKSGYDLKAFHVPKTVDNDLLVTDHCPGFGTAAKFVACAVMGDDLDNRALPGVKIDVIMGRHAGFLTGAAALAKQREDDGPHLVYVPERPITMDKFLADVEGVYKKLGRCVIAVSEGIGDVDHVTWAEKLAANAERDAHGNVQLSGTGALADFLAGQIKGKLNIKRVRADTFGYLQRSFAGLQSKTDAKEARMCGRKAVKFAMKEDNGSVAMKRTGNGKNYGVEYFRTELKNVAEKTKSVPDEYLNKDGNGMTKAFIEYALPLVGGLPQTEYLGGYPKI
jgi:6-phosphofructokinase